MTLLLSLADATPAFTPAALPGLTVWLDPTSGVYKDGAAAFDGNAANFLSLASNSSIQAGAGDFWWAGWVYPANASSTVLGKWDGANNDYVLTYGQVAPSNFTLGVQNPSGTQTNVTPAATSAQNAYHFVLAWYDATNGTINIQVDGGTVASAAHAGGIRNSGSELAVGVYSSIHSTALSGRIDSLAFGKTASGIASYIAALAASLYNAGAGKNSSDLTASEKSTWGLVSFWNLDEATGTRYDSQGSNHLTMTGTVGWAAGVVSGLCGDNDPVSKWVARTGQIFTAPSLAARPTFKTNAGRPYLLFDGVDDQLASASSIAFGVTYTQFSNYRRNSLSNAQCKYGMTAGDSGVALYYGGSGDEYASTLSNAVAYTTVGGDTAAHYRLYLRNGPGTDKIRQDGADVTGTVNAVSMTLRTDILYIGSLNGGGTTFYNGRIGDIGHYGAQLPASDYPKLERYLAGRTV